MKILNGLVEACPGLLGEEFKSAIKCLSNYVDLQTVSIESGQYLGTWKVPEAWKLLSLTIIRSDGLKIIDNKTEIEMVWQYSNPFEGDLSADELLKHCEISKHKTYRKLVVGYYSNTWGISLNTTEAQLIDQKYSYHVDLKTQFYPSELQISYSVKTGCSKEYILIEAPISFRRLANNLSGATAVANLYEHLSSMDTYYNYIFLFSSETIGPILAYEKLLKYYENDIIAAVSFMGLSNKKGINYKKSINSNTVFDLAFQQLAEQMSIPLGVQEFDLIVGSTCNEKSINNVLQNGITSRISSEIPGTNENYDTTADNIQNFNRSIYDYNIEIVVNIFDMIEKNASLRKVVTHEPFYSGLGLNSVFSAERDRYIVDSLIAFASTTKLSEFLSANIADYSEIKNWINLLIEKDVLMDSSSISFLTNNYLVRELKEYDVSEAYKSWLGDENTMRFLESTETTLGELRQFVSEKYDSRSAHLFGVFDRWTLRHIGNVKLEPIDYVLKTAEFGILIGESSFRGKGVGTEVLNGLLSFARQRLGLEVITLGVLKENRAAIALYKKLGFEIVEETEIFRQKLGIIEKEYRMKISI